MHIQIKIEHEDGTTQTFGGRTKLEALIKDQAGYIAEYIIRAGGSEYIIQAPATKKQLQAAASSCKVPTITVAPNTQVA